MKNDRISILMSTFNSSNYVLQTINSVLEQDYENWEFIIVDDASTDGTTKIIEEISEKERRIKLIKLLENKGQSFALNFGLENCSSELIARIDNDDLMNPSRLRVQKKFLDDNPDVAVISTFVEYIDKSGRIIGRSKSPLSKPKLMDIYYRKNKLIGFHHPAVMMRKSVIERVGGYRSQFWPADDIDLWNRVLEEGFSISILPHYLTKYRIHSNSISISKTKNTILIVHWLKECMMSRRNGIEEPSFDQFLESWKSRPLYNKINQTRKDLSKVLYKKAVFSFSVHSFASFLIYFLLGLILSPYKIIKQLSFRRVFWGS